MDAVTLALIKSLSGGGGGSSLPAVTSADNGKVLAVQDGAWAADESLLVVTRANSQLDHTYAEIKAALYAGRDVVLKTNAGLFAFVGMGSTSIVFMRTIVDANNRFNNYAIVKSDNTYSTIQLTMLPPASSANNGSELAVTGGSWKMQQKKFVVTLTPTSPDFSGTMDKTVEEITAAFEAGQEIVFKLQTAASSYIEVPVQLVGHNTTFTYPSFETSVVQSANNIQVFAYTGVTNDGTKQTYSTTVYSLTPAS